MALDFPDLHHKLCKKLAHLTTGFYHLHTRCDDNDQITKNVIETYEREMDRLVEAANIAIENNIKQNAQSVDIYKIRNAYKTFKDKIQDERTAAEEQFNVYREAVSDQEKKRQEDAQKQVNVYKKQVEDLKEKIWHLQKLIEKFVGSEVKFDDSELKAREAENQKIKKELEERNKEYGELKMKYLDLERMYKELEEMQAVSSDKITTHWSHELNDNGEIYHNGLRPEDWEVAELLRKKLVEQERVIIALKRAIGQEQGLLDGDEVASVDFGMSNHEMSNFSFQIKDLHRELMKSHKAVKEKDAEIVKLRDRLRENGSGEEYEHRLKEVSREHRKMIETLHQEYNENMEEIESQMEKDRQRWENILQNMKNTLDTRNDYITGLEEKLKSLEVLKGKMDQEIKNTQENEERETRLNQEIARLNKYSLELERRHEKEVKNIKEKAKEEIRRLIEEFKIDKERSLQALREELMSYHSSETEKAERIKALEAEIERLNQVPLEKLEERTRMLAEEYQNKVNELSQRHNNTLRELMEKHEERMNQTKKNYEKEIDEIKKELQREKDIILKMKEEDKNSEISNIKKEYEATLQKISKSYDQKLEEKLKEKDVEISDLRNEIDSVKEELKVEMEKLKEKTSNCKDLEKTIKMIQDEIQERTAEAEGGGSYKAELKKVKEGDYMNKEKEEIIKDHLRYAEHVEKKFRELKRQSEERVQMLIERYNELVDVFEKRPSRSEDLAVIRQLQEDGLEQEEEMRRMSEKIKSSESVRREEIKVFSAQQVLGGLSSMTISADKPRKNNKNMSPVNASGALPPISISQFSIQLRSPPASNGLLTSKKFFK